MLQLDRVLYPTDFSESSRQALPYAAALANRHGAELHVLHVLVLHASDPASLDQYFPLAEEVIEDWASRAEEALESETAERVEPDIDIHQELRRGISASPAILEYADEHDVDLVVMGTHGRRGVRHLMLGSVAEEVMRLAPCPVLAVRQQEDEVRHESFRSILVPVDFSEDADFALDHAVELAATYEAHVHLLYAVEQVTYPDFYYPVSSTREKMVRQIRETASERLSERMGVLEDRGLDVEFTVVVGRPAEEIVRVANERASDLVVMGSHGRTGFRRMILGSVAEGVVRRAMCPVLVVKSGEKSLVPGPSG